MSDATASAGQTAPDGESPAALSPTSAGAGGRTGSAVGGATTGGTDEALLMARLLWPEPIALTLSSTGRGAPGELLAEFLPLRLGDRTPILLPAGRRAAARAVRRHSQGLRVRQRWTRSMLSVGLISGLAQRVVRERLLVSRPPGTERRRTFDDYLRDLFGRDVLASISMGPLRANRKPVVQVITPGGRTLAFVKVGWNTLTRALARQEAGTLRRLEQAHVHVTIPPRLLHAGRWGSLEVLAVSALHQRTTVPRRRSSVPLAAMREVSQVSPWTDRPLHGTPFWDRLCAFRDVVTGDAHDDYARLLASLAPGGAGPVLCFGAWHGDWSPWNMAWQRNGTVQVWDWERFEAGVPVGFDALHYSVEAYSRRGGSLRSGVRHTAGKLPTLLSPFNVPPEHHVLVLKLYLLELFRRWYTDSSAELGGPLRTKATDLLRIIDSLLPTVPTTERR